MACEDILQDFDKYKPKYVKIFSDSQAAIMALDTSEMTSLLVKQTKITLNNLATRTQRLTLVWIKAHVGHEGNEEADKMAKQGTLNKEKYKQIGTPQAEIKSRISKFIRDKEWQAYTEGKHTKEFYTQNDKNKAKSLLTLSRFELSRFIGLITGHGNLAYFYSKLEQGSNPICRFCRERNETFIHLMECPRLRTYQNDCFLDKVIS